MELAGTVKCLLCRGRQPFDKRCFNEMEMHLKSQHRVIFFMKELIQCTKDAKNKEEILASQTIDVDMGVKEEDQSDVIIEYEHFPTNEQTVDEDCHSILVEDDDIPTSEPEYSTDSLMEVLEDLPVEIAQDSGSVPATEATISDKHPVDIAVQYNVNNAVDRIDENIVELNTTFPVVNERNEDLTELLRNQSNANIAPRPNELTNNYNLNNQLTLNSSVEALIDNLMSTEAFVNNMNWIENDSSLLYYNSEKSTECSTVLHPSDSKELNVNTQDGNTSSDECDEISTSNLEGSKTETVSILDKLDAFVDSPTRIMEIIHKSSETVDTTVLPPTNSKASSEMSKGSVELSSDLCESPQKSKRWYDLVPRGNAHVSSKIQTALVSDSSTNNCKRRMVFDKAQNETKKKFKSPLDSVSFYQNDKKEQALNDKKKLKCEQCNMRYVSKHTLKNHVCKGHILIPKIKKCRVDLHTITHKESYTITDKESHTITHKESSITHEENQAITDKMIHAITHKESQVQFESPANNNLNLKQGNKDKGKPFVCEGCGKHFSSEHGIKVHKMKMHS